MKVIFVIERQYNVIQTVFDALLIARPNQLGSKMAFECAGNGNDLIHDALELSLAPWRDTATDQHCDRMICRAAHTLIGKNIIDTLAW